jgi:hypothetical protein
MTFTGANLILVRQALALAIEHVTIEIGMCPDVELWGVEIEDLERDRASYQRLLARIDRKLLP